MKTNVVGSYRQVTLVGLVGAVVMVAAGCRGSSLWTVAAPVNEITEAALNSPTGAKQALVGAEWQFAQDLYGNPFIISGSGEGGVVLAAEVLSDEYTFPYLTYTGNVFPFFMDGPADARLTSAAESPSDTVLDTYDYGSATSELSQSERQTDASLSALLYTRSALLLPVPYLTANETGANRSLAGEALALAGYAELFLAEDYCAGVPLSQWVTGGGVAFGVPLSTDSVFGTAEAHFKQALTAADTNSTVIDLASVGLGRALVGRGRFDTAAAAVAQVPIGFVYNVYGSPNAGNVANNTPGNLFWSFYGIYFQYCGEFGYCAFPVIANNEGGTSNNFATSGDPRLALANMGYTIDRLQAGSSSPDPGNLPDSIEYWPLKFGSTPAAFVALPLATGIEAKMIAAEDSFWHGNPANLYPYLQMLRGQAPATYLNASSGVNNFRGDTTGSCGGKGDTLCVKTLFRERAFWLFGLGNRLGDMRREERQYGLADSLVFPHGPYWYDPTDSAALAQYYGSSQQPLWTYYGKDVSLSLPTAASGYNINNTTTINPNITTAGCMETDGTQIP